MPLPPYLTLRHTAVPRVDDLPFLVSLAVGAMRLLQVHGGTEPRFFLPNVPKEQRGSRYVYHNMMRIATGPQHEHISTESSAETRTMAYRLKEEIEELHLHVTLHGQPPTSMSVSVSCSYSW